MRVIFGVLLLSISLFSEGKASRVPFEELQSGNFGKTIVQFNISPGKTVRIETKLLYAIRFPDVTMTDKVLFPITGTNDEQLQALEHLKKRDISRRLFVTEMRENICSKDTKNLVSHNHQLKPLFSFAKDSFANWKGYAVSEFEIESIRVIYKIYFGDKAEPQQVIGMMNKRSEADGLGEIEKFIFIKEKGVCFNAAVYS